MLSPEAERWSNGRSRLVQHCDDATAAKLQAEGWTIQWNAHIGPGSHGAYRPHIAWRWE